jgi:hypothetical protein
MKKKLLILSLLISYSIFGQTSRFIKNTNTEKKLSIGITGGNYTQIIELNGNHLTNETSYIAGVRVGYKISKSSYLKIGYDRITTVSFSELSYDSYKVPFLLGGYIFNGKKYNSPLSFTSEIGPYLRGLSNFHDTTNLEYESNTTWGMQIAVNFRYDMSSKLYGTLSLTNGRDFDDILQSQDNNLRIRGFSALRLGFGFKF